MRLSSRILAVSAVLTITSLNSLSFATALPSTDLLVARQGASTPSPVGLADVNATDTSSSATASSSSSWSGAASSSGNATETTGGAANSNSTSAASSGGANSTWSGPDGNGTANATGLQGVSADGRPMFGTFCITQFCVNATYDGSSMMTYSLYGDASYFNGYVSIGTGSMMAGSNMFVLWSNGGEVMFSQRSSSGHSNPTVNPSSNTTAQLVPSLTSTNTSGFAATFTYPMHSTQFSSVMPMIWAYDDKAPTTPSDPSSKIPYQSLYGSVTLQLSTTGGTATKSAKRKSITWLINVHGIIMVVAWAVTAPLGALIGRYGRGIAPKWMKYHEVLQGLVMPFLSILGLVLAVAGAVIAKASHFAGKHQIMGLLCVILLLVQIVLGIWCHKKYDPLRRKRPLRNWLHMFIGMALLGLGGTSIYTGITLKGSPIWMLLAFWTWVGTLVIAFAGGYALMPKQMAKERSDAKVRRIQADVISSPISEKVNPYGRL